MSCSADNTAEGTILTRLPPIELPLLDTDLMYLVRGNGSYKGKVSDLATIDVYSIGSISNIPPVGQTLSLAIANNQNFKLPSLGDITAGTTYVIKSLNFIGVTYTSFGFELIDNILAPVRILPPYGAVTLVANTTTWLVI